MTPRVGGAQQLGQRGVSVTTAKRGAISTQNLSLDPDGAFEVDVEPSEEGRIVVRGERDGVPWQVVVNRHFEPGENLWSCELASATLTVTVAPAAAHAKSATYDVAREDATVFLSLQSAGDGRFGPFTVPAGRGTFKLAARLNEPEPQSRAIELAPGVSEEIDLR